MCTHFLSTIQTDYIQFSLTEREKNYNPICILFLVSVYLVGVAPYVEKKLDENWLNICCIISHRETHYFVIYSQSISFCLNKCFQLNMWSVAPQKTVEWKWENKTTKTFSGKFGLGIFYIWWVVYFPVNQKQQNNVSMFVQNKH